MHVRPRRSEMRSPRSCAARRARETRSDGGRRRHPRRAQAAGPGAQGPQRLGPFQGLGPDGGHVPTPCSNKGTSRAMVSMTARGSASTPRTRAQTRFRCRRRKAEHPVAWSVASPRRRLAVVAPPHECRPHAAVRLRAAAPLLDPKYTPICSTSTTFLVPQHLARRTRTYRSTTAGPAGQNLIIKDVFPGSS